MTNLEKYDSIFMENFRVEKSALTVDFTIETVENWDSLAQMQLITALEDAFGIMMDTDDIIDLHSYAGGRDILKKYDILI